MTEFTTYVGPYLILPKGFDWTPWGDLIQEGRGILGEGDETLTLIPVEPIANHKEPFGQGGETAVFECDTYLHLNGPTRLGKLMHELFKYCEQNDVEINDSWGVVPCLK